MLIVRETTKHALVFSLVEQGRRKSRYSRSKALQIINFKFILNLKRTRCFSLQQSMIRFVKVCLSYRAQNSLKNRVLRTSRNKSNETQTRKIPDFLCICTCFSLFQPFLRLMEKGPNKTNVVHIHSKKSNILRVRLVRSIFILIVRSILLAVVNFTRKRTGSDNDIASILWAQP